MTFRCVPTFQAASNDSSSTWVSFLQLTIKLRYSPVDVGDDGVGPKRFFAILDFSNIIIKFKYFSQVKLISFWVCIIALFVGAPFRCITVPPM